MIGLVGAAALAAADTPLAECRQLEESFDTKAMPAPCTAALDDVTNPLADRVDAARMLAFALVANNDPAGAEHAFLRMLALQQTATLPDSAGPRIREIFDKARARFLSEGTVSISAKATPDTASGSPGAFAVHVEVKDAFARVVALTATATSATTTVAPVRLPLVLGPDGHASGHLQAGSHDTCTVTATGADGAVLASAPCEGFVVAPAEEEPPWLWIGVGAGAVAVVGAGIGTLVWATTAGPLAPPAIVTVRIP